MHIKENKMKEAWGNLRQQAHRILGPLLLMIVFGSTAFAGQTPHFSVVSSGTANKLTAAATLAVADADKGRIGNTYIAFNLGDTWWFANNGSNWDVWTKGPYPVYVTGPLIDRTIGLVSNHDVSSLIGGELYVGYGLSQADMLTNTKFAMVYTVMADTTAPTVSTTFNANGATDIGINSKVGITFSEAMTLLTINDRLITLTETLTGMPVAGTLRYDGITAVFTPSLPLLPRTNYTVTVKGGPDGVKDLADNPMASDFVISWTSGLAPDITAPTVSWILPANGQTNVPINIQLNATFSEWMDPLTLNPATFTLRQGTTLVPGTVTHSGVSALFIPTQALSNKTVYTVTIKGGVAGVKDLAGNPLKNDFIIKWTSVPDHTDYTDHTDRIAPTVTGTINPNGAINVPINTTVGATFSEGMDPLTITNVNFTLTETLSGIAVPGLVNYASVNAVFTPLNHLTHDTLYTVTIKGGVNGVKDLAGNALLNDFVIQWRVIPDYTDYTDHTDRTAPTVTATLIPNGATNVPINTTVGATFSEGMNPLTITNVNFTLKGSVSGTAIPGVVSYSGVNVVFTPLSSFASNTAYTATIKGGASGVKDLAGNPLIIDQIWSWRTSANVDAAPPMVSGTVEADGAVNVAINAKIGASFSEGMDPLTITNLNFTLTDENNANVPGTVSFSGLNAAFIPTNTLTPNAIYTATIKGGITGVKDLASNPMVGDAVWSWTTALGTDSTPPMVSSVIPADAATGVTIDSPITVQFDEAMDHMTISTASVTLHEDANPLVLIPGTVLYDPQTSIATFTPASHLTNGTAYTATVKITAKDMAGNPLTVAKVWGFTTLTPLAAVDLLSAGHFVILAKTTITDVLPSTIVGNIGVSPAAGSFIDVKCAEMTGKIYTVDATYVGSGDVTCVEPGPGANKTLVDNAILDMGTAYADASGRTSPDATELGAGNISGLTIAPGLYKWSTDVTINTDVFLSGTANDVWIFQIAGNLSIAAGGSVPAGIKVILSGGAQAKNIFWQVGGLTGATLGTYSTFHGNILSAKQVVLRTGAVLTGRAFADSQVVLEQNAVTKPAP
jgi:hypothetical protein